MGDLTTYMESYGLGASSTALVDLHIRSIYESLNTFYQNPFLGAGYFFVGSVIAEHNLYLFLLASSGLLTLVPYILSLWGADLINKKSND